MSASQLVDLLGTPHAMYAVVDSSASDFVYLSVVSLGASLDEVAVASVGTCVDTSPGAAPEDASLSFTLDSGASHCFFRDRTTLTLLPRPVSVALADPTSGPVTARYTIPLPCPAVPSGSPTGFHVPSFSRIEAARESARGAAAAAATAPNPCHCPPLGSHVSPGCRVSLGSCVWSGLPRVLPLLPALLAPPCEPCIEGRLCATPHSSSLRQATEPFETLHLDVWGPASRSGPERESFFLVVVDDYSRYTTVFPLAKKSDVTSMLIRWLLTTADTRGRRVSCLHSDLRESPQQNGVAERRIGLVMEIARTSMTHASAPYFLWPYAVWYAAHQLNLWPCVSRPEVSPTSLWTGSLGAVSRFRVLGCLALVRDTSADKISPRAVPCVFIGFPEGSSDYTFTTLPFTGSLTLVTSVSTSPSPTTSGTPVEVSRLPPLIPPRQPTADPAGAGFRGEDPRGASSRGAGVGAKSVPVRGPGSGGAGFGAEPVTAGDSSLRGAGISGAVPGGATTGGVPSAGHGEPGTDPVTSGGASSGGGATGSLERGPGATTAPDTTPPPHPYPTRHQARVRRAREEQLELEREERELEWQHKDGLSLFDLTSGASTAPAADADSAVRSQWLTRDAAARLAVRSHLPSTECAHFSQYKSAKTLYDAIVAHYSSPATAALSRLMLPYMFPDLAAFAIVTNLITHLRTSDTRYRAALPAEFCAKNPPPMYITLYYLVTRLPDTLRSVRDHFLSLCPTTLTVDLLEERLLAAETSITAVGASRGDPPRGAATARASGARALEEVAREAVVAVKAKVGVGVEAEVGASVAAVEVEVAVAVVIGVEAVAAEVELVEVELGSGVWGCSRETPSPQQLREWYAGRQGSGGAGPCTYALRTGDRAGEQYGGLHATQRCFGRLTDAWRTQFPDATEIPRWGDLLKSGVAIFDLDFDAILAAMYAVSISAEGDCYVCVPPDPGIGAASLCASESAAPGTSASALSGTASAQVLHTFTLDSGASRSFFRDCTTLTPLSRPVAVSLADPSGGPVLARYSTVLLCPVAPSGSLSSLYLPSFSTNLVSAADLQDGGVDQFTLASQRVTHCTCARTGRHLATFTRRPGSSLYTQTTESPQVAASGQVAASSQVFAAASQSGPESAPCSCRLLSLQTLLWHHRLGHPSLPRLRGMASRVLVSGLPQSLPPLPPGPAPTCVPCVEGRQRAAPHSSEFPPTEAPLQTLHMDVWGPARVRGQGHERYFLLVVDDYSRYTTVFPLRRKDEVTEVLIAQIRVARLQIRERFGSDFPILRLHSDRGGEFSSDLLRAFCHAEGISQVFTLPASPQENGIAECRIGMVMDVARTSMIHATAPHFLWLFAVQYAAHQINLQPRVSIPETSPTLRWTGKVGDASAFHVWGSRAFVHDLSADKLSSRADPCDVTFDESVPYYRLFSYRTAPLPPTAAFPHARSPPSIPPPPSGSCPLSVQSLGGARSRGAEPERAEPLGAGSGGAEPGVAESGGAEPAGAGPGGPSGALSRRELPSPQELREWFARRWSRAAEAGGAAGAGGTGAAGCSGATGAGATGGAGAGRAAGVGATGGTGAGAAGGTGARGAAGAGAPVGAGVGATGAAGGAPGAGGAAGVGADAGGTGAVPAGSGGAARPRPYFVPLLEQVLGLPPSPGPAPLLECPPPVQSESQLQLASPLPAPSPYAGPTGVLAERCEPESRPASPVFPARTSRRVPRPRPLAVPGTHQMALRPSTASQRVALPSPPASSLPALPDPESDSLRAASPTVTRFLAIVVSDPSFESTAASSCVAEIYAGTMAAQELRWLTYLLTDLGEPPRSPPVLYVDNKAMLALCREHRLEHRVKHIALRYFLARELQQHGQLRLAYVASQANSADIFTKALQPCDHQRFCTMLGLLALFCFA
ncbi:unnamed protein product [Closterium sp. NIES-53]